MIRICSACKKILGYVHLQTGARSPEPFTEDVAGPPVYSHSMYGPCLAEWSRGLARQSAERLPRPRG